MSKQETQFFDLLYSALETPFGIVVQTSDAEFLRQKLYPLRNKLIQFEVLSFIISPENLKDLWILRRPDPDG